MEYCPHCMRPVTGGFCGECGKAVNCENPNHLLQVGTVLSGSSAGRSYQLGVPLGQGGFGVTYIGVELETGRRVAVKEYFPTRSSCRGTGGVVDPLPGQQEGYESGRFSFLKEAHMLSSLEGMPSVVQALDYLETNNTAYLVMEFLEGTPLYRIVNERGKIPAGDLLPRLQPLMRDIGRLHAKNVIHRDISPDNVMWMKDGSLKLLDFGCARSTEDGRSMTVALKQGFAPVEQYQSKGQGPYTDVYALAATIYYCLTGVIPPSSVERQLSGSLLQSPTSLGAALTPDQESALLWAMTVDPKSRPANMDAFSRRLFLTMPAGPVTTGTNPVYPGGAPVNTGTNPTYPGSGPVNTGTNPIYPGGVPVNAGTNPAYPGTGPANAGPVTRGNSGGWVPGGGSGVPASTPVSTPGAAPQPNRKLLIPAIAAAAAVLVGAIVLATGVLGGDSAESPSPSPTGTYSPAPQPSGTNNGSLPVVSPTPVQPSPSGQVQTGTTEDGFVYELRDGYAVITGYTDTTQEIVSMPDDIENCRVTRIEANALAGASQIESLYLPTGLSEVGQDAFRDCSNLRDLYLYSNVEADGNCFTGCSRLRCVVRFNSAALTGVKLPNDCILVDRGMETGAGKLRYVWVMDDGTVYGVTEDDAAVLLSVPAGLTDLTVRGTIGSYSTSWIYAEAFDGASTLTTVSLPDELAFDPVVFTDIMAADTIDMNGGSFVQAWCYTCLLCTYINDARSSALPEIQPAQALVRAAMTRAEELQDTYDINRPNGDKWSTLLEGFDWSTGVESIRRQGSMEQVESLSDYMDSLTATYAAEDDDGDLYTDVGFGVYYGDQLYMACILTAN